MHTDEATTIGDPEEAAWVARQRDIVIDYLIRERCEHNGVSQEPRWFVAPYVAVWAVRSKADAGRVGWGAVSGDLPTDYITASHQKSTGDVLISFAKQWRDAADRMTRGEHADGDFVGDPSQAKSLAPLLLKRAELLQQFGEDLNNGRAAGRG